MSLSSALYRNCRFTSNNLINSIKWSLDKRQPYKAVRSIYICNSVHRPKIDTKYLCSSTKCLRQCSTQNEKNIPIEESPKSTTKKPGLIQRFREMYRDYWYVLVPVHLGTSAVWLGCFYYTVRSGVDIVGLLESIGVSEKLMTHLKDSNAGYFALTFALYKIAAPLRYAVTIGGTTYAIRKLTILGWIQPVPSRERIKEILQEKKDHLQDRFHESKQHYQTQMKEKHNQVIEEMRKYKSDIRNIKDKVKKM